MALKTINDLTALTTPASTDLVGVWAVGAARMRKSTIAQTFSPMLAAANVFSGKQTLDALLALKKNVAPGTTSGYLELGTDANGDLKVQNDAGAARTLAGSISGGGTVATAGYTLTVPATGTAAIRNASNMFTEIVLQSSARSVSVAAGVTVAQSLVELLQVNDGTRSFGLIMVSGSGGGGSFCDLVLVSPYWAATVIESVGTGSPAARTYNKDNPYLRVSMASDTYTVYAHMISNVI